MGIEPVLADLTGLDLGRSFDVVLALSRHPTEGQSEGPSDDVEIELHDLEHRPGGLRAKVTYRIDGHAFAQSFDAVALDDAEVADEAARHGLAFLRRLDEDEELGLLTTA